MGRILNCAEQQKLLWSVKVYNHIALSGLMLKGTLVISQTYASERTGCTALGQKVIFSAYFYLEIHEHNPTTIQQLEGIPGKDIHVCICTYTYNTQHSHQSAFSRGVSLVHFFLPTVSLIHFDPYIQADTWLKEKEPRDHRDMKPRPSFLSELRGMR